ncbi:hypothetical protein CcCBS67573_g00130 [Chytriomyces confervae]|uniref:Carboxypeptidase n=1 Tax=Chytriomyces confervae TaxID=246404 RepID=A0A507FQM0_9FUNG|nr:hypothetical protein HDU80_009851 [Chytriomyces hyalinus]TPX78563.1 hypothetical protein CcCBS67573_g00130 [Chytriomyces confervae]
MLALLALAVAALASPVHKQQQQVLKPADDGKFTVLSHAELPGYALRSKEVGLCDTGVKQSSGYLDVDSKHFFFWFFESRSNPSTDPLILWLNGGPGCSSLTGLFMELGPCSVTTGGNSTPYNENSWNSNANIIFLDQPTNVGFSYSDSADSDVSTTADAANDVYSFLQLFLKANPKFEKSPFHVTGESYAGHYIPAIADTILTGNNDAGAPDNDSDLLVINLASIAIGNGLTDPAVQYEYYPQYACGNPYGPILEQSECDAMSGKYGTCKSIIEGCYKYQSQWTCVPGAVYCNSAMISPFQKTGLNIYDIRQKCDPNNPLCYSILGDIEAYLNQPDIQEALGVDVAYKGCNMEVNQRFMLAGDWMRPYVNLMPNILEEGVKVLIYAGDADYICNYMGNRAWTLELEWSGKDGFNAAPESEWVSEKTGKKAGMFRTFENLSYLTVYEAGHMVPYDQPEHSLEFINKWISKTW